MKTTINPVPDAFEGAKDKVDDAVLYLEWLRGRYVKSDCDDRKARIRSLNSKIDALKAIKLEARAWPWSEDFL